MPAPVPTTPDELVVDTRSHADVSCVDLTTEAIAALSGGDSFILRADHDPCGLRYMLDAEMPGVTTWQQLQDGPELWEVRIAKVAAAS
jgi:uncharacterized protein (DUF2249 family)